MAHANRVLQSINNEDASLCVDIFLRPEGTVGFEEFRRDFEDNRGWSAIGGYASQSFADHPAALAAAKATVPWLRGAMGS